MLAWSLIRLSSYIHDLSVDWSCFTSHFSLKLMIQRTWSERWNKSEYIHVLQSTKRVLQKRVIKSEEFVYQWSKIDFYSIHFLWASCFSNSSIRFWLVSIWWRNLATSLLQSLESTWQWLDTTVDNVFNSSDVLKSLLTQLFLNKSIRFRLFRPEKAWTSMNLMLL